MVNLPKDLSEESNSIADNYSNYSITDNSDYVAGGNNLKEIKTQLSIVLKEKKEILDPIKQSEKAAREFFKKIEDRLNVAEESIKKEMSRYLSEKEKSDKEEKEKAEQAKKDRVKQLEEEAIKASEQGDTERAAEIVHEAEMTEMECDDSLLLSETPKISGVSVRTIWKFSIEDEGLIPDKYKSIDMKAIRGVVNALKDKTEIPGVDVFSEKSIASGKA